jgi:hypothetical protein
MAASGGVLLACEARNPGGKPRKLITSQEVEHRRMSQTSTGSKTSRVPSAAYTGSTLLVKRDGICRGSAGKPEAPPAVSLSTILQTRTGWSFSPL